MLAHALTGLRLLLVPLFGWSMLRPEAAGLAAACLALGIASDLLDGRVARWQGSATAFGRLFDHATDCAFVSAGLLGAALRGALPCLLPPLVVAAFAQYVIDSLWLRRQRELRMSWLGRWNGVLYFVPLAGDVIARLGAPWLHAPAAWVAWGLVATSLLSMADRAHALLRPS